MDIFGNAPVAAGFKPEYPGEFPTLGFEAIHWMTQFLARPTVTRYEPFSPTREQAEFLLRWYRLDPITGQRKYRRGVIQRPKGWGKAESLDNVVPTPDGYKRFGDLRVGDYVYGADGKPTMVVQTHPMIEDYGYTVTASDGSEGVFHENHTFVVREFTGSARKLVEVSVGSMADRGLAYPRALTKGRTKASKSDVSRFALQEPPSLSNPGTELPVDPYVLGVWLGDGDSDSGRVTFNADDLEHMTARMGVKELRLRWNDAHTAARATVPGLIVKLRALGVLGNKHIPARYLRASKADRLELMRGLMDSDGHVEASGVRAEYCTTSERLAEGVRGLLFSLGYRPSVLVGAAKLYGREVSKKYRIRFRPRPDYPVVSLPRKVSRIRPLARAPHPRVIADIRRTEQKVLMRCITVEAPDGQYLTGRSHWVTHNSPFLSAIVAFEALGNCRFAGWDANGRPVGAPWNAERKVEISLLAVSEDQTRNAFEPMKEMMGTDHLAAYYPGLEVMETRILLPFNGMIKPRTASAASFEGTPQVFTIADQTETWLPNNGGVELGAVAKRNMSKTDGTLLEAPNAFVPGAGSFAELTWEAYQKAIAGDSFRDSILYDTRDWGEPDLDDPNSVIAGLEHAYGDSLKSAHGCRIHTPPCGVDGSPYPGGWVNINGVLDDVFDPATTLSDAARYFGNKPHAAADAFLDMSQLAAATFYDLKAAGIQPPSARDKIVLGFDGSWGRSKGITDATAIVAMRVSDGLSWAVRVWEQPDTAEGRDWEPPRQEIDAVMRQTIQSFDVVDGLFDPSGWETAAAEWENLISTRRVERQQLSTMTKAPPRYGSMMWRGNQLAAVAAATQALRIAIIEKEVMITGSSDLSRHILNAVYRETRAGKILYKESPSSARKIDAAYALMLAHQSRLRVLAKGTGADQTRGVMQPMRIR